MRRICKWELSDSCHLKWVLCCRLTYHRPHHSSDVPNEIKTWQWQSNNQFFTDKSRTQTPNPISLDFRIFWMLVIVYCILSTHPVHPWKSGLLPLQRFIRFFLGYFVHSFSLRFNYFTFFLFVSYTFYLHWKRGGFLAGSLKSLKLGREGVKAWHIFLTRLLRL